MPRMSGDELLSALRERLTHDARPPLSEPALCEAEARLGFALPLLLRRVYGEVANGGFGPRLLPLTLPNESFSAWRLNSVVLWYRGLRDELPTLEDFDPEVDDPPHSEWPAGLLMISDWGCNIYSLVDCSQEEMSVLRHDNNISLTILAQEASSLHEWLERWLEDERLFHLDWEAAAKTRLPTLQPPRRPGEPPETGTDTTA